jgi:hypothetical protein
VSLTGSGALRCGGPVSAGGEDGRVGNAREPPAGEPEAESACSPGGPARGLHRLGLRRWNAHGDTLLR